MISQEKRESAGKAERKLKGGIWIMIFEVVGAGGKGSHVFESVSDALDYLRWLHSMGEDAVVYEAYIYKGRVMRRGFCPEMRETRSKE